MDLDALKQNLLTASWRKYSTVSVEGRDGPVDLVIRRPPDTELVKLFKTAERDGLMRTDGKEVSNDAALRFRARVVALTIFAPNAVHPLFTEDEALGWPGLHEVAEACQDALLPAGAAVERAKGK